MLGLMAGLVLLATAMAWHDLSTREVLGRDENATITKLDQPGLRAVLAVTKMKVTGQPGNMQPLYFLLQHLFWPVVGRSAFVLRFLPSVFGVLCVALTFKLGEVLWSRESGLVGALLTALLPLHVRYAQIARPYTLLALLSLASAYFLVRSLQTNRLRDWFGFAVTACLSFYTHYNALLVLASEGLVAGAFWLAWLIAALRMHRSPGRLWRPALCFLVVAVLCAPGFISLLNVSGAEVGGQVAIDLTLPFLVRFLYRIGLTPPWLRGLILGLIGLGLAVTLYRRRWQAALFAALWLAIPFVALSVLKSSRPFAERYVIFVPPVALLLAGQGVVALGELAGAVGRWRSAEGMRRATAVAISAGLGLLFVTPLSAYYAEGHTADRLDQTLKVVEARAGPDDLVIVSPRFFVRPLAVDGAQVLYLVRQPSEAEFEELLSRAPRTWILYTSYLPPVELQEPLDRWVQARADQFVRVPIKAINALAYSNHAETDDVAALKDRVGLLEELAVVSADDQEAWFRYGVLADVYQSLSQLYDERGEAALAAVYQKKAEEARATAPPPW